MGFWEWFTRIIGIIGVVAFLLAVQQFIKMWLRTPKIIIDFGEYSDGALFFLRCEIYNEPITSRFWRFCRISRQNADGIVAFYELEAGSGQLLFRSNSTQIKIMAGVTAERATLPPSIFPATFPIVVVNNGQVLIKDDRESNGQILQYGRYKVKVTISYELKVFKDERNFIVQHKHPFAYWDINS